MEKINVGRIISESTKQQIIKEVAEFVGNDRHRVQFGLVSIGDKPEFSDEIVEDIINVVCRHYKVNKSIVLSSTRRMPFVKYRQLILYLCRKYTKLDLKTIGEQVGNVDHSTVIHSIKTIKGYLEHDSDFVGTVSDIEDELYF